MDSCQYPNGDLQAIAIRPQRLPDGHFGDILGTFATFEPGHEHQMAREGGSACSSVFGRKEDESYPVGYGAKRQFRRYGGIGSLAVLVISVAGTFSTAEAQQLQGELIPNEDLQARFDRREPGIGAVLDDGLSIRPLVQFDDSFDDNIFATSTQRRADMVMTASGSTALDYASGPDILKLDALTLQHIYALNSNQNEWEAAYTGIFRRQIYDNVQLNLGGGAQRAIDARGDPTGFDGFTPTTYWKYDGYAGSVIGNPLSDLLEFRVGASRFKYDPLQGIDGPIDTGERSHWELYGLTHFDHTLFGQQKFFAEVRANQQIYDHFFDDDGFRRNSSGLRATSGAIFDLHSIFYITTSSGFQIQNYADQRFGTVTEPNGNLSISWWPTLLTNVKLNYTHEYQEGFFEGAPGSIRNRVIFEVDHELRRNLLLTVGVRDERLDVVRSTQADQEQIAEAKLQYQFQTGLATVLDYRYDHQIGIGGLGSFAKNVVTVSLKKMF
jgi:hypothetical protein